MPLFKGYFETEQPVISELTFTDLFVWGDFETPYWTVIDDSLLIFMGNPGGNISYALPPAGKGDKTQAFRNIVSVMKGESADACIRRVPEGLLKYLEPIEHTRTYDRDNSDYLYLTEELINMTGKKFHRKKNRLNKFIKNNRYEYRKLDGSMADGVFAVQNKWCGIKVCKTSEELVKETASVKKLLYCFGELGLKGGVIAIEGKIEAFIAGELLNRETAVIHAEKADLEIDGIYTALLNMFCREEWRGIKYINRGPDLGQEGLRKSKTDMNPAGLVKKYNVRMDK